MSFYKIFDKIPNKVNLIRAIFNKISETINQKRGENEKENYEKYYK